MRWIGLFVGMIASLVGARAQAADIQAKMINGSEAITVIGEIVTGDELRFKAVASKVQGKPIILLDSPGGKLIDGLIIGQTIRANRYATFIPHAATCASVCGLIWLAGTERFISRSGHVGFHAAANLNGAEVGNGNAVIGAYLTKLGLSYDAVIYMTSAPPSGIRWLNADAAARLGIAVTTVDNVTTSAKVVPADRAPAVPATPPVSDAQPPTTVAYTEGQHDRVEYEQWLQALTDQSYHDGAVFWAANRTVTPPPSCSPHGRNGNWQSGCVVARAKLGPVDRRRRTDEDYSLGWNSL